jgi:hypothetical protein
MIADVIDSIARPLPSGPKRLGNLREGDGGPRFELAACVCFSVGDVDRWVSSGKVGELMPHDSGSPHVVTYDSPDVEQRATLLFSSTTRRERRARWLNRCGMELRNNPWRSSNCGNRKSSKWFGVPDGIRTRVTALKGRRPRPLDDRDAGADLPHVIRVQQVQWVQKVQRVGAWSSWGDQGGPEVFLNPGWI